MPSWPVVPPQEVGFAADLPEKLDAGIRSGLLPGLHAVLVCRAGRLALERYDKGVDQSWGRPLGEVAFAPDVLHDLRSVTKSVVGLLYGIALDRGLVPAPDAPLLDRFPGHADLAGDGRRARITIAHALTMTLGNDWDEQRPYTDPANSEIAMENAPDRIRFVLERPMLAEPGTAWTYSGGAVALIGTLIEKGTGEQLPDFARRVLFEPLGIDTFEWAAGADGVASAASGLRLKPRDLLRLGTLLLGDGEAQGRRIVSKAWIEACFRPAIATGDGLDYGRLWFLGSAPAPAFAAEKRWIAGFGNGGQRLFLMPEADLAVVICGGRYDRPDAWVGPTRVWREIVLANLMQL